MIPENAMIQDAAIGKSIFENAPLPEKKSNYWHVRLLENMIGYKIDWTHRV